MGSKITSIPAEKLSSWHERSVQQNLLIFVRVGATTTLNGEQTSRAIAMLSVLTGNVGINGGNSGVREGSWDLG